MTEVSRGHYETLILLQKSRILKFNKYEGGRVGRPNSTGTFKRGVSFKYR